MRRPWRAAASRRNWKVLSMGVFSFLAGGRGADAKMAVAFGGGGARGWAHLGALQAFREFGFRPDVVTGTSIGSIAAAAYATGTVHKLERFAEDIGWREATKLFVEFSAKRSGLIEGRRVMDFLVDTFGRVDIEDLPVKYAAVAVNLETAEEIVFTKGPLVNAIRASISLPGLFTPVGWNGSHLIDGGFVNPVPIDVARRLGADCVVAINLNNHKRLPHGTADKAAAAHGECGGRRKEGRARDAIAEGVAEIAQKLQNPPWRKGRGGDVEAGSDLWMFDVYNMASRIAEDRLSMLCVARDAPDVLIEPPVADISTMDFMRSEETVKAGYDATKEAFERHRRLLRRAFRGDAGRSNA